MVDLVYGRGITDLVREFPLYMTFFHNIIDIKLFHKKNTFKKQRLFGVTLVGGEPTMRPDVIEVFCQEMPGRVCVVTNGTFPLKRFENLYFYWVSLDGTE